MLATIHKFRQRFAYIEAQAQHQDKVLEDMTLQEMDQLWDQAKEYLKRFIHDDSNFYGALCALITSLLFSSSLYAQAFDQQYQAWKSQQQAHDARLQSSHSNYYLAKPSLQANAGPKVNINTATAKDLQQLHGVGEKRHSQL